MSEPASAVQTEGLPAGFERDLARLGITYTVVDDPTGQQVGPARESVLGGFNAFLEEDTTAVVVHVRFTDKNYGSVDDPDAPNPIVRPYFTDREALMMVLPNQTMGVSHPLDLPGNDWVDPPETANGTFVAFVDISSNEVLRAASWGA